MPSLTFYTRSGRAKNIAAGKETFFSGLLKLIEDQGWQVKIDVLDGVSKMGVGILEDYAIVEKLLVPHENVLSFRESAYKGFWTIEKAEFRNNFRLTGREFDPESYPARQSRRYAAALLSREKQPVRPLPNAQDINVEGAVLIALQGRLLDQRTEQYCSPLDMIRAVRAHEPHKKIIARVHPGNGNSEEELSALSALCMELDVEISNESLKSDFARAHYIVTMNSTVAQKGMLLGIPSLLFAHADYHHICISLMHGTPINEAFAQIKVHKPDYERYLLWYVNKNMLDTVQKTSQVRALNMLVDLGFPLKNL